MAEMNSEWVSVSFYSGKYSEALEKLHQLEVNNPTAINMELRNMKGLCFMRLGKASDAKTVFDEILAVDPGNQEAQANRKAAVDAAKHIHMDVGDKLFQKGQYEQALEAYNSIEVAPDDLILRFQITNNKGAVMMNMGRVDDAIVAFNEALRLQPSNSDTLHNKGTALKVLGRYDEALISYDECLRHEPDAYAALCGKCETLTSIGRFQEAEQAIERAVNKNPADYRAYSDRGFARLKLHKYSLAIADFDDAIRKGDSTAECKKLLSLALSLRGDQLSTEGNHPEALRTYERALALTNEANETPNANLLFNHSLSLLNSGNSTAAINGFKRVIQVKPDHFQAHNALGLVMMQTGRWNEALESLVAASKLNTEDNDLLYNLGVVYLNLGQLERSSKYFRDLLRRDPSHAQGQKALATVESQLSFHAASDSGATSKMAEEVISKVIAERPPQPQPVVVQTPTPVVVVEEVKTPVREVVDGVTSYSYSELRAPGPYPAGINSDKREVYLSDNEFRSLFGVDKKAFESQPKWKQVSKKRELLLF